MPITEPDTLSRIEGPVAHDAANDSARRPVKTGGVYKSAPSAVADGDITDIVTDNRGHPLVTLGTPNATGTIGTFGHDIDQRGLGTPNGLLVASAPYLYSELGGSSANYDRQRNNVDSTVLASAARTATANSADQTNYNHRGAKLIQDITAVSGTAPTLDTKVQTKDAVSAAYRDVPGAAFPQKTAVDTDDLTVYPGVGETANEAVSDVLSRVWRVVATIGGTSPSFTFSLGAGYVL